MTQIVPQPENLAKLVYLIRGEKVLLDADLAALYGVATKVLNQAAKRNLDRFPTDFMFQLTPEEWAGMRSQTVTSSTGSSTMKSQIGSASRRKLTAAPYAFTEQGVAMLSSVLRSERAIAANIAIMRAFVRMREILATHTVLARKLNELERRIDSQDETIVEILGAIRQLMAPPAAPARRPIGFIIPDERKK